MLGLKQGPVMLTIVPPSMCPFSGAKVKGKLVPTKIHLDLNCDMNWNLDKLTQISDTNSGNNFFVDPENMATWKSIGSSSSRQITNVSGLEFNLDFLTCHSEF